jgi:hypothetical protein
MRTVPTIIVLLMLLNLSAHAQNRMQVGVYAMSDHSEQALSWFMDQADASGSQVAVQVIDARTGQFLSNCRVSGIAYHLADPETIVTFTSDDLNEVSTGLYILKKQEGFFGAVFNRSGMIKIDVKVFKAGYHSGDANAVFFNKDFVNGYSSPGNEFVLFPPQYLSTNENDPRYIITYKNEKYYSVALDFEDKQGNFSSLIVPVHKATHQIPSDWKTYSEAAKALTVAYQHRLFSLENANKMLKDVESIKKQLPILAGSGKAIEVLTPLFQTLVRAAGTGGSSLTLDVPKLLSVEAARFFLSEASDPINYSEGFFYRKIKSNLRQTADTMAYLIQLTETIQQKGQPLSSEVAYSLYDKWKYALLSLAFTIDLIENKYADKPVGAKMLEEQVKSLISSQLPIEMKLIEMASYLDKNQRAMLSAMEKSEKIKQALYLNFDYVWDKDGDAGDVFNAIAGKKVKESKKEPLPPIGQLQCLNYGFKHVLKWDISGIRPTGVNYVIKYSDEPITARNWNNAWYFPSQVDPQCSSGSCEVLIPNDLVRNKGFYFAIKYFDMTHQASPISALKIRCGE